MQGRKQFADEKALCYSLSAHVPGHNFYRRLKQQLHLNFLYELTAPYYGPCGQQSIDPVVFFKVCLIGYLENIISDRKLVEYCSLRLDLLFPWIISSKSRCPGILLFRAPSSFCRSLCLQKYLPVCYFYVWKMA